MGKDQLLKMFLRGFIFGIAVFVLWLGVRWLHNCPNNLVQMIVDLLLLTIILMKLLSLEDKREGGVMPFLACILGIIPANLAASAVEMKWFWGFSIKTSGVEYWLMYLPYGLSYVALLVGFVKFLSLMATLITKRKTLKEDLKDKQKLNKFSDRYECSCALLTFFWCWFFTLYL